MIRTTRSSPTTTTFRYDDRGCDTTTTVHNDEKWGTFSVSNIFCWELSWFWLFFVVVDSRRSGQVWVGHYDESGRILNSSESGRILNTNCYAIVILQSGRILNRRKWTYSE